MKELKESIFHDKVIECNRVLHTPGDFAKQNLLYVEEVGELQNSQFQICAHRQQELYIFFMILKGRVTVEYAGKTANLEEGTCALLDCAQHFNGLRYEDNVTKIAWVYFNGVQARNYYELFLKYNRDKNVFCAGKGVEIENDILQLISVQEEKNILSDLKSGELLISLLNKIVANVVNDSILKDEEEKLIVEKIRRMVNEHYQKKDIEHYLEENLKLSFKSMDDSFKKICGITIGEYIYDRRYNAAKELLRFTVMPITKVVEEAGVERVEVLQKMFKEHDKMTAEEYRQKWAGWIRN